jgi:hypothetical protein
VRQVGAGLGISARNVRRLMGRILCLELELELLRSRPLGGC